MEQVLPTPTVQEREREEKILRRAVELSGRRRLPKFSLEDLLARVPDDWREGEDDVDEFLNSLRGKARR
ncbi:MAG: hypothetical protein SF028_15530 [Candidatus Sumerlaeia bacterium]|nr:hypothetical protein [Candidatus Sumerlaeia bacterium]